MTGPDSRDLECHHRRKPCCETQCKQHFRTAARDCFLSPSTMKGIITESGPAPCWNGALVPLGSSYCQAYFNVFKLAYIMMGFIIISSYMWIIYSYITLCCSSSLRSHFPNRPLLYLCLICVYYFSLVSPYTRKHDISLRVWLIFVNMLTCTSVYFPANNSQSHCSLWLNKSPLCINTTFSPSICLSGLL